MHGIGIGLFLGSGGFLFITVNGDVLIMVVCYSRVTEQLIVEYIIPASGCNSIPPVDIDFAVIEIQARTIVITVVFLIPRL